MTARRRSDRELSAVCARAHLRARSAYSCRGGWASPQPARLRVGRWSDLGRSVRGRAVPSLYTLGPVGTLP